MTMNITRTKNKGRKEREGKEEKNDWKKKGKDILEMPRDGVVRFRRF